MQPRLTTDLKKKKKKCNNDRIIIPLGSALCTPSPRDQHEEAAKSAMNLRARECCGAAQPTRCCQQGRMEAHKKKSKVLECDLFSRSPQILLVARWFRVTRGVWVYTKRFISNIVLRSQLVRP